MSNVMSNVSKNFPPMRVWLVVCWLFGLTSCDVKRCRGHVNSGSQKHDIDGRFKAWLFYLKEPVDEVHPKVRSV